MTPTCGADALFLFLGVTGVPGFCSQSAQYSFCLFRLTAVCPGPQQVTPVPQVSALPEPWCLYVASCPGASAAVLLRTPDARRPTQHLSPATSSQGLARGRTHSERMVHMEGLGACWGHPSEAGWAPLVLQPGRGKARAEATPAPSRPVGRGQWPRPVSGRWDTGGQPSGCRDSASDRSPHGLEEPSASAGVRPPETGWTSWARLGERLSTEGWGGRGDHFVPVLLLGSSVSGPRGPPCHPPGRASALSGRAPL